MRFNRRLIFPVYLSVLGALAVTSCTLMSPSTSTSNYQEDLSVHRPTVELQSPEEGPEQVEKMDINKERPGTGIGGRMVDTLIKKGIVAGTVSVYGIAEALVSELTSLFVADPFDYQLFNPMSWAQPLWETLKHLNKFTNIGSGLFGETWSTRVLQSLSENDLLYNAITSTTTSVNFPEDEIGE